MTTIALEEDLHRRLALAALEDRSAAAELVRVALREWLDKREAKRGRKR